MKIALIAKAAARYWVISLSRVGCAADAGEPRRLVSSATGSVAGIAEAPDLSRVLNAKDPGCRGIRNLILT
jgi:hypothetical protein